MAAPAHFQYLKGKIVSSWIAASQHINKRSRNIGFTFIGDMSMQTLCLNTQCYFEASQVVQTSKFLTLTKKLGSFNFLISKWFLQMIFTLSIKNCKNQSTAQIFFFFLNICSFNTCSKAHFSPLAPYATMSSSANKPNFGLLRCPLKLAYFFLFV